MKKAQLILLIIFFPLLIKAQDKNNKKFGISFSGFVKNDCFFDTRQTIAAREGHFLLFPQPVSEDPNGKDINAKSNLNFLAVQSRLSGKISGPDAFGAKTSGLIEGDFFAQHNDNINLFRLRHAFLKLKWSNTELLAGQYWNALFITDCYPGTVSFNTGTPVQPFARNPQLRLTQHMGALKMLAIAQTQRDYTSPGGSSSLRNAAAPDLHFQLHYDKLQGNTGVIFGAGLGYKSLVPELETSLGYKTTEKVSGLSYIGFLKYKNPAFTLKLEGVYGENLYDVLSMGGYAVSEIVNATTGIVEYETINVNSYWLDLHTNGKSFQAGIFAGYSKNLGAKQDVQAPFFTRGENIDYLYRIAPRVLFNSGKVRLAAEFEYTAAAYGELTEKAKVTNSEEVANLRFLLSFYYFF